MPDNLPAVWDEDFRPKKLSNKSVRKKFCVECKKELGNASKYLEHLFTNHKIYSIGLNQMFHEQVQTGFVC